MTWETQTEAIRLALASALRLPDVLGSTGRYKHVVEWENRRTAHRVVRDAWADLRLTSVAPVGTDEIRYSLVDSPLPSLATYRPCYVGWRIATVGVLVASTSQEHSDAAPSELAGRLRTRLRRPDILAVLQAEKVGLATVGPTVIADYLDGEQRWVSAAIVDVRFVLAVADEDPTDPGDFIASVEGQGEGDLCGTDVDEP